MSKSFAAQVGKWASETPQRLKAVRDRAVTKLGDQLSTSVNDGGQVPFKTGTLARSLLADNKGLPTVSNDAPSGNNVALVAFQTALDAPIWLGYTMVYARRMNYGFVGEDSMGRSYNQNGFYFVEGALANWQKYVEDAVTEVRNESGN